ncbi:MAG: phosphomannose isomerase type II C-terminal cupin domain [Acidobacteria bacterium]|nr:phosphomannose isomerase type II C-terminal cupin domain [Acidobacteriota bacterium]
MDRHVMVDHRPWGRFLQLDLGPGYQVKRIEVFPGQRLSLQSHEHRDETWTVVRGQALVTLDEQQRRLMVGESVQIARRQKHRVQNPGDELLIFIEVQIGDYLGEDDIRRYADDYDRG